MNEIKIIQIQSINIHLLIRQTDLYANIKKDKGT